MRRMSHSGRNSFLHLKKSQVMEDALEKGDSSKLSISEMKNQLQKAMGQNAGAREVKPLRECPRFDSFFMNS